MNISSSGRHSRLSEAAGLVFFIFGLLVWLSLVSYHPEDPSWNTAAGNRPAQNLIGLAGSHLADLCFQAFGILSFLAPTVLIVLAWKWIRSRPIEVPLARTLGVALFAMSSCAALELGPDWNLFGGAISPGGVLGMLLADSLVGVLNVTGSLIVSGAGLILSLYLATSFRLAHTAPLAARPAAGFRSLAERWRAWRSRPKRRPLRKREPEAAVPELPAPADEQYYAPEPQTYYAEPVPPPSNTYSAPPPPPVQETYSAPPWETQSSQPFPFASQPVEDIPIRPFEDPPPQSRPSPLIVEPPPEPEPLVPPSTVQADPRQRPRTPYRLPATALLNEPPARRAYDEQELKDIAGRIKSKFEEFNVFGSVVQINPGPVVTTFEYKPDAGVKYSRITTLNEDLCLGLQAESIIIERIPGKPTVGIEVPNSRREVISLRQILESDEFNNSPSYLTIALGKDASGRIKVAPLESMPHLLIAGSTGSGKSVMLNSLIMSVLYKATPDQVRMILVDPKRLEMGLYEGIPHLLTPVITDAKKATNALRNAVLEMERRLRLLASQGVRNIEQFNKKMRQLSAEPPRLFTENKEEPAEDLQPLPYILILIDELADLMMVEGRNVEESITRLAQMARAVGMHLVVATQRPSVDVITGLIKANFPARISFRVATRVDSRTILDVMGAEHLLGKGDMLFLPPGMSRLVRVHGAFVTETEINRVVDEWKAQAAPEYDQSFLVAPPTDDGEEPEPAAGSDEEDPLYRDAVRVVLEVGKASTSILQRRLRLGYGRAARILDMMQRDGIVGPPDGSKPREVLKRPDWLDEIDDQLQ